MSQINIPESLEGLVFGHDSKASPDLIDHIDSVRRYVARFTPRPVFDHEQSYLSALRSSLFDSFMSFLSAAISSLPTPVGSPYGIRPADIHIFLERLRHDPKASPRELLSAFDFYDPDPFLDSLIYALGYDLPPDDVEFIYPDVKGDPDLVAGFERRFSKVSYALRTASSLLADNELSLAYHYLEAVYDAFCLDWVRRAVRRLIDDVTPLWYSDMSTCPLASGMAFTFCSYLRIDEPARDLASNMTDGTISIHLSEMTATAFARSEVIKGQKVWTCGVDHLFAEGTSTYRLVYIFDSGLETLRVYDPTTKEFPEQLDAYRGELHALISRLASQSDLDRDLDHTSKIKPTSSAKLPAEWLVHIAEYVTVKPNISFTPRVFFEEIRSHLDCCREADEIVKNVPHYLTASLVTECRPHLEQPEKR